MLIGRAAGRTLPPLQRIMEVVRLITSEEVETRFEIPPNTERETSTLVKVLDTLPRATRPRRGGPPP